MLRSATGETLSAQDLYGLLTLRVTVFVVEQECPYQELDGKDLLPDTVHVWWQPADTPLACLRILADPGGVARIGRVCTALSARGTGLGGLLMTEALARIGAAESVLDAQTQAMGVYARFGFVAEGEPFDEDGIEHIRMRRASGG